MKCQLPDCGGTLQVTHTYQANTEAETRNLKCVECGMKYSSVAFLVERPSQKAKSKGHGAVALAKKVREGNLSLEKSDP